jgi:hypothetical protein
LAIGGNGELLLWSTAVAKVRAFAADVSGRIDARALYVCFARMRDMIARNRPYDEFVRGIIAAAGEWQDAPAINWYWQMRDDQLHQPVADTAQVFLGLRLQCAKCHHHPYERISQTDYYSFAAFFSRVGNKPSQEFGIFGQETVIMVKADGEVGHP